MTKDEIVKRLEDWITHDGDYENLDQIVIKILKAEGK